MEVILSTDLTKVLPKAIEFNYEPLKAELSEKLKDYENRVVTAESTKNAKEDVTKLNKLSEAIDRVRIDTKKEYLAPFEDFESKCKELSGMVVSAKSTIDKQVKAFAEQEQNAKYADIQAFYKSKIGSLLGPVPLDKILNPKWKNATLSLKSICEEMAEKITRIGNDLKIITAFGSEFDVQIKDAYLRAFDMSAALAEKKRLEEQKEQLEKIRQEQARKVAEQTEAPAEESLPKQAYYAPPAAPSPKQSETRTIKVIFYDTTPEFRQVMGELTRQHNIRYGGLQ
jgi:hypothetical protein